MTANPSDRVGAIPMDDDLHVRCALCRSLEESAYAKSTPDGEPLCREHAMEPVACAYCEDEHPRHELTAENVCGECGEELEEYRRNVSVKAELGEVRHG